MIGSDSNEGVNLDEVLHYGDNKELILVHNDEDDDINNENEEDDNEYRDDQPLLKGEEQRERDNNNNNDDDNEDNDNNNIELRIPVRLQKQKMRAAKARKRVLHRPYFTIVISVIDVILMIAEIIVNKGFVSFKKNPWIGVSLETLILMGGKDTGLITALHPQIWRILTPVFLHVGLGHLVLNLIAQLILGFQLERVLGTPRIIILYFISAMAGNLMSAVFLPFELEVGASTAIYGLGSYYLVDLLVHWSLIISPMRYFMGLMIGSIVGLLFGLLPGIDNFAHIGGSAGGFLVSLLLVPRTKEGKSLRYAKLATIIGPPLLLIYFALGFAILFTPVLRTSVWGCKWCEYLNCLPVFHWCQ